MQLTNRDREILRQVFRHRFLRSVHIAVLVGGSIQVVSRRLQLLYHHGYLERPRAQIEYYHQGGSQAMVYGLAARGLELIKSTEYTADSTVERGDSNRAVKRLFLEHALLISDVMVTLELACRRHDRIRLLNVDELALPDNPHARRRPFGWKVNLNGSAKLGVVPDRVFAIEFPNQQTGPNRVHYFLEADRATMPIVRQTLRQSSFHRKMLAYQTTWTQQLHRKYFGFHRFRVLTVTTSTDRLKNLVESCRQLERGHGLFLFTDADSLAKHSDILSLPWQSGSGGQAHRLIDG